MKKFYVGLKDGVKTAFASYGVPTEKTHPLFAAVIGPFKTKHAAEYMARHRYCENVAKAEEATAKIRQHNKGKHKETTCLFCKAYVGFTGRLLHDYGCPATK